MKPSQVQGAQAVSRALLVLRCIARSRAQGASLGALTQESGLNKPTVHRLVLALMADGMVEQDAASLRYFLGPECYVLGRIADERHGLGLAAGAGAARLAQLCGDSAFFSVRSDLSCVCLIREDGGYPLKTHVLMPGVRHPLGVGAGSLAVLAALDDAEVERCLHENAALLDSDYPDYSVPQLRQLVLQTRERGYAVNEGLVVAGSWGLGAAVRSPSGEIMGAYTIAAVAARLPPDRQRELSVPLLHEAALLERHLAQMSLPRQDGGRRIAAR